MAKKKRLRQVASRSTENEGDACKRKKNETSKTEEARKAERNEPGFSKQLLTSTDKTKTDIGKENQIAKSATPVTSSVAKHSSKFDAPSSSGAAKVTEDVKEKTDSVMKKLENLKEKADRHHKLYKKRIKDPRLIPRMKEYLQSRKNKNFISIPQMAEYLQHSYPEYARKKKSSFVTYVDKAFSQISHKGDIKSLLSRKDSEQSVAVGNSEDAELSEVSYWSSSEGENETLVEYKDTNAMNTMMSNLYKNSQSNKSQENSSKQGLKGKPEDEGNHSEKPVESVVYPSPDATQRNFKSTGLVGPRRTKFDKYFIDRKGDNENASNCESNKGGECAVSREATIQKFLGCLPSRTSYSAYVRNRNHSAQDMQKLYRVYKENGEENPNAHSGITSDNTGATFTPPRSPTPAVEWMESNTVQDIPDPRLKQSEGRDKETGSGQDTLISSDGGLRDVKSLKTPKKQKKSKKSDNGDKENEGKRKGIEPQKSTVTFTDVGGNEANLTEICKLLVHMRHPEVYQQLGVTPPRGFLLHGPPGCGKTLLANAIAGELDLPMLKLAATEIVSGVSGDSEEKIRDLFEKATQTAPCVIFIDEIDSITPKRETASKDMERRIVAQLLACMDDLNANQSCHVLVIGATNRPDSLDPALRRAGRFDKEICLGIPDELSRCRILAVLCRNLKLEEGFDYAYLARNTPGYVGADLMALSREAAMTAVNRVFKDLQSRHDDSNKSSETLSTTNSSQCNYVPMDHTETVGTGSFNVNPVSTRDTCSSDKSKTASDKFKINTSDDGNLLTWLSNQPSSVSCDMDTSEHKESSFTQIKGDKSVAEIKEDNCDQTPASDCVPCVGNTVSADSCPNSGMSAVGDLNSTDTGIKQNGQVHATSNAESVQGSSGTLSEPVQKQSTKQAEYLTVLSWLKEQPPLTSDQLKDLCISMEDFKEALKFVQPSAKREGFATIPDVTWDDIGALRDVQEELQLAILAPVRHPEQFRSLGLTRAQGILLAGPPGCGKTLLAKAVANESGINFISVKGPELLNMYVGESERAVRTVFQRARNSAPCVIFFDELDALCPRRSGSSEGNSSARVVNQLLTEMDGLEERKQVFIMAATNRPDIIDPAVLRPGRLDKTLYVGLPRSKDRLDILTCITKNGSQPLLGSDVDLTQISEDSRTDCFTGADLAALVREASVSALKEAITKQGTQSSQVITVKGEHFETAFKKVKPSVSQKDQERYHQMKQKLILE